MKRHLTAVAAGLALALLSAGNALAGGSSPVPLPAPGSQSNDSSQGQVQVVPIAPQLNVQNANVLTGDVEQGDAADANTGQTAQQENTAVGQSQAGPQSNDSSQGQVQVVPIAPQANVQNVNVATFGDVEQGDAANANTGQTAQQENTAAASHGRSSASGGESHAGAQENRSHQGQVQVIPVAPQLNVQNVNVATFGDVEQGDAANANTGQTAQQENTAKDTSGTSPARHRCGGCSPSKHSGGQSNRSVQKQVQIVPIAPQANLQNVNVSTFGDVEQGDAANANTGQTTQQENTRVAGTHGKHEPEHCYDACKPRYEAKPRPCGSYEACEPRPEPKPRPCDSYAKHDSHGTCEPRPEPKPCDAYAKHDSYGKCEPRPQPKPRSKPCDADGKHGSYPPKHGGAQSNASHQGQVQILPIAPQLNVQNVNLLTFGDVEQGDAANANTGQVVQQSNRLLPAQPSGESYRTVA
ncbi:MAG TPA: hypothetical protein VFR43_00425 [Gaiellaceae bacterium]|nr:hypothetical protein [Gaiellaceae bacterium]